MGRRFAALVVRLVWAQVRMLVAWFHAEHNPLVCRSDNIQQTPWMDAVSYSSSAVRCLARIRRGALE
jgi:hypothetical protein